MTMEENEVDLEQQKKESIITDLLSLCNNPVIPVFNWLTENLGPRMIQEIVQENQFAIDPATYDLVLSDIRKNLLDLGLQGLDEAKVTLPSSLIFKPGITASDQIRTDNEIRFEIQAMTWLSTARWGFYMTLAGYGYYSSSSTGPGVIHGPFYNPMGIYWQVENGNMYEFRYDSKGHILSD